MLFRSHFPVKCRGGKLPYDRSSGHQNLLYVDDFDQSSLEEYTPDVITHHITAVEDAKSCPKQLFTSVTINDSKDATFQLDCGATCNLLPLKIFSSIMGNPQDLYFKRISATLKMYNGSTMSPLGRCTLRCTKGEVSLLLTLATHTRQIKKRTSGTSQSTETLMVSCSNRSLHFQQERMVHHCRLLVRLF